MSQTRLRYIQLHRLLVVNGINYWVLSRTSVCFQLNLFFSLFPLPISVSFHFRFLYCWRIWRSAVYTTTHLVNLALFLNHTAGGKMIVFFHSSFSLKGQIITNQIKFPVVNFDFVSICKSTIWICVKQTSMDIFVRFFFKLTAQGSAHY